MTSTQSSVLPHSMRTLAKKLSVNRKLLFRAAFHAVFGRRHGHTKAS